MYDWVDKMAPQDQERDDLGTKFSHPLNFERIVDDFIFLAMFVGNDFLPVIPGIEVHSHGMDIVLKNYKRHVLSYFDTAKSGEETQVGYLLNKGNVPMSPLDLILPHTQVQWRNVLKFLHYLAVDEGASRKKAATDLRTLSHPIFVLIGSRFSRSHAPLR